jgi:molecular chaperone DnaJ
MAVSREWLEKDYYAALGVAKGASQAEVKKAYRKLAQQFHPDANAGDKKAEERFKEISAAYDVLGDEKKRAEYDRVREMGAAGFGGGFRGGPGGGPGPGGFGGFDPSDLFGDLFGRFGGGGFGGGRVPRGADLETEVSISFEEGLEGATVPVSIRGPAPCQACGGSGAEPGTAVQTCPQCGGSGQVAQNQGPFSIARGCPQCGGSGRLIERRCTTCGGSGSTQRTRTLRVKIPAGVEDGARIRLAGRGEPGPAGGAAGDLFVVVRVAPHRFFRRRGADLMLDLPVTFPEAALGAKVDVPTLNGPVKLKIPAGTKNGRVFRVRGRGAPKRKGSGTGDLLVKVQVDVPSRLSKEERQALEQFQEAHSESPRRSLGV